MNDAKATGRAGIEPARVRYSGARAWPLGDGGLYFSLFLSGIYCRASCFFVFSGGGSRRVAGGEGGGDGRAAGVAVEEGGGDVEGEVEVDDPRAGG